MSNLRDRVAANADRLEAPGGTTALAQPERGAIEQRREPPKNVAELLTSKKEDLMSSLAMLYGDVDLQRRWVRLALTECRKNPDLFRCTVESFTGALMLCAQLDLEPGSPNGYAWILPFKNRYKDPASGRWMDRLEATFILGYPGVLQLAFRSGMVRRFHGEVVYTTDKFDFDLLTGEKYHKRPLDGENGEIKGFYGHAELTNGGESYFRYMSRAQMEKHRDTYSKTAQYENRRLAENPNYVRKGPWFDSEESFAAMGTKTMVRLGRVYVPMSTEWKGLELAFKAEEQSLRWDRERQQVLIEGEGNEVGTILLEEARNLNAGAPEEAQEGVEPVAEGTEVQEKAQQPAPAAQEAAPAAAPEESAGSANEGSRGRKGRSRAPQSPSGEQPQDFVPEDGA